MTPQVASQSAVSQEQVDNILQENDALRTNLAALEQVKTRSGGLGCTNIAAIEHDITSSGEHDPEPCLQSSAVRSSVESLFTVAAFRPVNRTLNRISQNALLSVELLPVLQENSALSSDLCAVEQVIISAHSGVLMFDEVLSCRTF